MENGEVPDRSHVEPPDQDRPALRRCIAIEPAEFARSHWGREPLLSRGIDGPADGPAGFADLFSAAAVDELVSERGLRSPFLRMAKNGRVIDAAGYTGSGGTGAEIADQAYDDRVMALFADGATLVLQGLHRLWRPLIDLAGGLVTDLGHPVQINAYVTPTANRGFDPHYDTHDVFVLQITGEKRWHVHRPVLEAPLRSMPWSDRAGQVAAAAEEAPLIDTVLRPGDALYLPRGFLHSAQALGGTSIHLTIGVHALTLHTLATTLLEMAGEDAALRQALPLGIDVADPDDLAAPLADTVRILRDRLDDVLGGLADVGPEHRVARSLTAAMRRRVWPSSRPGPLSPLAQAEAVHTLTDDTRLALRRNLPTRLEPDGEHVLVRYRDRWLRFPAVAGPALRAVLAGTVDAVGDLPGLDHTERLAVASRLLLEGLLVPAPPMA